MRHRTYGRSALESRLDDTIGHFKDAITDLKEAIRDNKEALQQLKSSFETSLAKTEAKAESSRRWSIGLVVTVALATISFMLTNGFQIQL